MTLNLSQVQLEPGYELLLAGRIPFASQLNEMDENILSLDIISEERKIVLKVEIDPQQEIITITSQLNVRNIPI